MQHVADGTLHAYLDGALGTPTDAGASSEGVTAADVRAHLEGCADCRVRLSEARTVRERAGMILDDAGGTSRDLPSFELISGSVPKQRRRVWLPLGWAASVLLAVGGGWWASEIQRLDDVRAPAAATQPEQAVPAAPVAPPVADVPRTPPAVQSRLPESSVARPVADDVDHAPRGLADVGSGVSGGTALRSFESDALVDPAAADAYGADVEQFRDRLAAVRADSSAWRLPGGDAASHEVLIVDDAGGAVVAVAAPTIGWGELVRVRQRLATGEDIELVIGQPQRVALNELVVTGASESGQRRLAAPAVTQPAAKTGVAGDAVSRPAVVDVVSSEQLRDGTAEIVVRLPATGMFVAVRGPLSPGELTGLARRLVRPGR